MPQIDKAVAEYNLNEYYDRALSLIISGRAREAFDLRRESAATRDLYGRNTFGQSCLLARRLVEAGHPRRRGGLAQGGELRQSLVGPPPGPHGADEEPVGADARRRAVGPADRPRRARAACRDAGRRRGRVRPQPAEGREHLGQRQQRRRPRPLAVLLHRL